MIYESQKKKSSGEKTNSPGAFAGSLYMLDDRQLDAAAKRLLGCKELLACILKEVVDEFKHCPTTQIMHCIEGEVAIDTDFVEPFDGPGSIKGAQTEDSVVGEGLVRYDVKFYAVVPGGEKVQLIINVEAQKGDLSVPRLVNRGIYYGARLIAAQNGKEFAHSEYERVKKVYSIWVCMNVPRDIAHSITRYHLAQEVLAGSFCHKAGIDLMSVLFICLGKHGSPQERLLKLLDAIFIKYESAETVTQMMAEEYHLQPTPEFKGGLGAMTGYGAFLLERGIEKGIEKGRLENLLDLYNGGLLAENEVLLRLRKILTNQPDLLPLVEPYPAIYSKL